MTPIIEKQELPLMAKIHAPNYIVISATANKDGDVFYIIKDGRITAIKMIDVWHDCKGCYGKFLSADGTEYENGRLIANKFLDNSKNGFLFFFGKTNNDGFAFACSSVEDARIAKPMNEKRLNEMLVAPFGEDGEPETLNNSADNRWITAFGYKLNQDRKPYYSWNCFYYFAIVTTEYGDMVTFIERNNDNNLERVWLKDGSLFANEELAEHHAKRERSEMDVVDFPNEENSEKAKRTATVMVGTIKISDFTFDNPSRFIKLCNEIAQVILDNENEKEN